MTWKGGGGGEKKGSTHMTRPIIVAAESSRSVEGKPCEAASARKRSSTFTSMEVVAAMIVLPPGDPVAKSGLPSACERGVFHPQWLDKTSRDTGKSRPKLCHTRLLWMRPQACVRLAHLHHDRGRHAGAWALATQARPVRVSESGAPWKLPACDAHSARGVRVMPKMK
jgi:hypothetical protein